MADTKFVLSLDGGGMRGIVPGIVLEAIEERTGKPIADCFDLIGGTSTGGILALGLAVPNAGRRPHYAASDLVALYTDHGHEIFHKDLRKQIASVKGWFDELYDETRLERILQQYFGGVTMARAVTELVVTSYDMFTSRPYLFKRKYGIEQTQWDHPMWWGARSTSAAPTYFEPFRIPPSDDDDSEHVLVDGGVFANNPAVCAYIEAIKLWGNQTPMIVCSVGTGDKAMRGRTKAELDGWGKIEWAQKILDTVFDGVADTVDYQMEILSGTAPQHTYFRFQADIPSDMSAAMDVATPDQVERLRRLGAEVVNQNRAMLDELCELLRQREAPPDLPDLPNHAAGEVEAPHPPAPVG